MRRTRPPHIKMPGDGRKRFWDTELTQAFESDRATPTPSRRQIANASSGAGGGVGCTCDTSELEALIAALTARVDTLEDALEALESAFYHSLDFSDARNSFYFPLVG